MGNSLPSLYKVEAQMFPTAQFELPHAVGGMTFPAFSDAVRAWRFYVEVALEDAIRDERTAVTGFMSHSERGRQTFLRFADKALHRALQAEHYLNELMDLHPQWVK